MLMNTRPPVITDSVLICCTKYVGEEMPDRIATRNLIRSVSEPSAADQPNGSGRANPNAISSASIPHRSASRQKSACSFRSGAPLICVWACVRRIASPTDDRLQWKRIASGILLGLLGQLALADPRQDLLAEEDHRVQVRASLEQELGDADPFVL